MDMNVGCRTLEKAIKSATGDTFREFQSKLLLNRVRSILTSEPTLAIKDVSFNVGYKSARSFARSVKRMCGLSPHDLRAQLAKDHRFEITHSAMGRPTRRKRSV